MSGHDGIYRYSYQTSGAGGGYVSGGLSGTFNLGWWSFLGKPAERYYQHQLSSIPFSNEMKALYLNPVVTDASAPRPRHPHFASKNYLDGSLLIIVLESAVEVSQVPQKCLQGE